MKVRAREINAALLAIFAVDDDDSDEDDGHGMCACLFSQTKSKREDRHAVRLELLKMINGLDDFKKMVAGVDFEVALKMMLKMSEAAAKRRSAVSTVTELMTKGGRVNKCRLTGSDVSIKDATTTKKRASLKSK